MDFTQTTYKTLLETIKSKDYSFLSFADYLHSANHTFNHSVLLLRHDVDRLPQNSLKLAQLEHSFGIKGTYFFRVVPESYNLEIMNKIAELGHEIGYHYEDIDLVSRSQKSEVRSQNEIIELAHESFCKNLEMFRKNFDIKTICMHGSPRSKYDNKMIWEKYDYKELGILGEPYFDLDFDEFAYFTDTGRRWNGQKYSVRDKVTSKKYGEISSRFKTTQQIIDNINLLPDKVMFTVHPERWYDKPLPWVKELVWQNLKNVVKRMVVSRDQRSEVGDQKSEVTEARDQLEKNKR